MTDVTQEEKALAVFNARKYLDVFCTATDPLYTIPWHIELVVEKLEQGLAKVLRGEKVRLIIEMPPRHGKSELATVKFPAWVLGRHPDLPVVVTSYSADLATTFGLKTRDLMNDENYQAIFSTRLRADQKAKGKWLVTKPQPGGKIRTTGGGYTAAGVGGGITGRGFKIGIIDDPIKNREEAEREVVEENIWEWYKDVFYTRQEGNGMIVLILQRWAKYDLVGRVLEKAESDERAGIEARDEWDVIRLPAIADENEYHEGKIIRRPGDPLWPEKFTLPMLEGIRNTLGPYGWNALYQQSPISSETQEFTQNLFKRYDEIEIEKKQLTSKTFVDLSHAQGKESHNTVVRTVSKIPTEPGFYLREETAGHLNPLQTIDAIFYHARTYRSEVWIEGVGYQRALKSFVEEEMRKRGEYFIVNLLKRNAEVAKHERIRGLIPYYRTGVVYHRRDGLDEALEREMLDFPQGKLDDRVDCLANMLEAFSPTQQIRHKARKPHVPLSPFGG